MRGSLVLPAPAAAARRSAWPGSGSPGYGAWSDFQRSCQQQESCRVSGVCTPERDADTQRVAVWLEREPREVRGPENGQRSAEKRRHSGQCPRQLGHGAATCCCCGLQRSQGKVGTGVLGHLAGIHSQFTKAHEVLQGLQEWWWDRQQWHSG